MKRLILFLTLLLFYSCNEKKDAIKVNAKTDIVSKKEKSEKKTEIDTVIKLAKSQKSNTDYSNKAELFANEVLEENIRTHVFDIADVNKPMHTEIFENVGLLKIDAYSNENYPEKVEPNRYEHFTLFVATYGDEINALKNFALIKMASKKQPAEYLLTNKKFVRRIKALNIGAKPGGMIIQKGKQIFSLVETCRRVPINGNWNDYENKLITHLADEDGEEFQVLNSNCGDSYYRIETRKAIR
tara:strand:- start:356 stop:1081 length:726 start_codon:yes stop_codon:yes gene_type:complete